MGRMEITPLPQTLVESHNSDTLVMDYCYFQGILFHQSISTGYKFRTIEALRSKKKPKHADVKAQSKRAINIYHTRGIAVKQINADNEFEVLTDEIRPIPVNIVGSGEHVGDIERSNRTV